MHDRSSIPHGTDADTDTCTHVPQSSASHLLCLAFLLVVHSLLLSKLVIVFDAEVVIRRILSDSASKASCDFMFDLMASVKRGSTWEKHTQKPRKEKMARRR